MDPTAAEAALSRVGKSLGRAVERDKLTSDDRDSILSRIVVTTDLGDQADRQLVIEAATENEALKRQIFTDLDEVVEDPSAVLASNTSSNPR